MKKNRVTILFLVLLITSCGTYPVTVATSNVTKPVIVGNYPTLNGSFQEEFPNKIENFSLSAEFSFGSVMNHLATKREGPNKFDVGLLRVASGDDESELIVIDRISFFGKKSEALILPFVMNSDYTIGYLDGAIYKK